MRFLLSLTLMLTTVAATAAPAVDTDLNKTVEGWRAARIARLTAPDGWLSLVGLHWLEGERARIGSDRDNDVVLAVGPAHLGVLTKRGKSWHLELTEGVDAKIGDGVERGADLASDASGKPTRVVFGSANFTVIERSGRFALRVRDAEAKTRKEFTGMKYFAIDPAWHIAAHFEPHPPGRTIDIATVIGTIEPMANPGAVVFDRDGKTHRIEAVDEGDGELFLIFADRTNGRETYGPGRFLYAHPPAEGSNAVDLDFNQSYNPPCSFTPHATCPLPPPENRLNLAVTAGEKKYEGGHH